MTPISVALVDDSDVYRTALRRVLSRFADIELTIDASEPEELMTRLAGAPTAVALVDLRMPRMPGAQVIRAISCRYPDTKPIALTVSDDRDDLVGVLDAGSYGYVLKAAPPGEIADSIRAVSRGDAWVSGKMTRTLIHEFSKLQALAPRMGVGSEAHLTEREQTVLQELSLGRTNREIGEQLYIAETTVKSHVKSILEKLGARNRVEAVLYAYQRGRRNE